MKTVVTTNDCKKISLDGLKLFAQFCKKNGLTYFLAYGSLLGAVRHKGFIPWDDDIDVLMPREDYERLITLSNSLSNNEWELLSYKTNENYLYFWSKFCNRKTEIHPSRFNNGFIYGISIDIFPLDIITADCLEEAEEKLHYFKDKLHNAIKECRPFAIEKLDLFNRIKALLKKIYFELIGKKKNIKEKYLCLEHEILSRDDKNQYYFALIQDFSRFDIFEKELLFGEFIDLEFEGCFFKAPCKYDLLLKVFYGDYMKLPPENERVTHHSFICYYKNDSCKERK